MGTCGATCGITKERAKDLERARLTAERVHPGLTWSSTAELAPRVVPYDRLVRVGSTLEELLPVRVHVHAGEQGECDSLYVLAGLHRACLAEVVDDAAPFDPASAALGQSETYVRVAISPHGPFATLSEVVVSCELEDDALVVTQEPQAGVVDRRLQHIIKGLQGALRREGLIVLDLSAMLAPIEGAAPSRELTRAFDEPVNLWSLLFEALSPLAPRVSLVPRAHDGARAPSPARYPSGLAREA
jgi:hypothetical protein